MDIIYIESEPFYWVWLPVGIVGFVILTGLINWAVDELFNRGRDLSIFYVLTLGIALIAGLFTLGGWFYHEEAQKVAALSEKHQAAVEYLDDSRFIVYGEETFVVELINIKDNKHYEIRI